MATEPVKRRIYQRSKIPPKRRPRSGMAVHPIIRFIWDKMNEEEWSQEDLAKTAGVNSGTMRKWRNATRSPRLLELEAVVNALGYRITLEDDTHGRSADFSRKGDLLVDGARWRVRPDRRDQKMKGSTNDRERVDRGDRAAEARSGEVERSGEGASPDAGACG